MNNMDNKTLKNVKYYSLTLWKDPTKRGEDYYYTYKTLAGAKRAAGRLLAQYQEITIRHNNVIFRDQFNEFSSSGPETTLKREDIEK